MRWDFFRYLLDIQGLTDAASKDGGGRGREIAGSKEKDKSEPQLLSLSSKSLHHHHPQLIVDISPNNSNTTLSPSKSGTPSSDKKSPQCSSSKVVPVDTSPPIKITSIEDKINSISTKNPSLVIINEDGNVMVDEPINQSVSIQKRKGFLSSTTSSPSTSSSTWNKRNKSSNTATTRTNDSDHITNDNDANNEENNHSSAPSSFPSISNLYHSQKDDNDQIRNKCVNFNIVTVSLNVNSGHSDSKCEAQSRRDEENVSFASPRKRRCMLNSISSSTDANNAEADEVAAKKGLGVDTSRDSGDPATEDEASSISSSSPAKSSPLDNKECVCEEVVIVKDDIDEKSTRRNSNESGITTTCTTETSYLSSSNSAENHDHDPSQQQTGKPPTLESSLDFPKQLPVIFTPSPRFSSSFNTLRWTKAVAKQETEYYHQQIYATLGRKHDNKRSPLSDFMKASGYNTGSSSAWSTTSAIKVEDGRNRCAGNDLVSRPTSIIGCNNVAPLRYEGFPCGVDEIGTDDATTSPSANNHALIFQDKWRKLFDKFDREGFGEIPWTEFRVALRSKEFSHLEPGKLQMLEDLARVHSTQTNSITFQLFVSIMTGKRSRSFKCAVHHRDREVCSESDFHLLPLGYQPPTGVKRMAKLIADEFLTDSRERKLYAERYQCFPPPLFIISITLIELGFFTYYTVWHGEISSSGPLPIDSYFVYRPDKRQEVYRFLSYMVLHAGWVHLMFNLLVQLLVGLPLEMVHGSLRIGCVYMAGVLAGSLGTSVFDPDVYLVGASGGVYALLAAHLANVLLNYNNMEFGLVRLLGVFLIASVDVGFAIYDRYAASPPLTEGSVPPVSYVAHLTGALAGLTIGLLVLKNFEQKLREQLMWWVALGVYAACTLFAILFNIFHPVYPAEMIPSEFVEIPEKFPHHQIQ